MNRRSPRSTNSRRPISKADLRSLAAAFSSAAAQREAAAKAAEAKFATEHPEATDTQKQKVYENALQQQRLQYDQTIQQVAQQHDLNYEYDQQIEKFTAAKEVLQSYGRSTLAIDAAIDDEKTKNIQQWDQMAAKVGTLTDRFHAFWNEIEQQGDKFGEHVFSTFTKGIDDISTQLARLVVTGKSSFREMWNSLAESLIKAQIQKAFGQIAGIASGAVPGAGPAAANAPGGTAGIFRGPLGIGGEIAGALGVKTPGLGGAGRADGSQSNPFYTIPVDLQGNVVLGQGAPASGENPLYTPALYGSANSGSSGISSQLASMVSGLKSTFSSIFSSISSVISDLAKSLGKVFKGIGSLFGGFLAGGGDVTPGKAYIVGEKHPEFFVPRQVGQVAPSLRMQGGHMINMGGIHIHGVQDFDSFQRSQGQLAAQMYRLSAIAHARNG